VPRIKPIYAVVLVSLAILPILSVAGDEEPVITVFKDPEGDVLVDTEDRPLESASDLEQLEDKEAPESSEREYVDIIALRMGGDDTYVEFQLEMNKFILARHEYTYAIAGYSEKDPERDGKFDFLIEFNNGTTSHKVWKEGRFEKAGNISNVSILDNTINITVHRSKFSLQKREDPYLLCAFAYLDQGEGRDITLDYLISKEEEDGGFNFFDDDNLLLFQLGFFFLLFTGLLIIYNIWSKKKGEEFSGGVCPECESRLDPNLDFCPSCGRIIRGPKSNGENIDEKIPIEE